MLQTNGLIWNPYCLRHGAEFAGFWEQHLAERERDVLYILGRGFDRRMCKGIDAILSAGGEGKRDCLLIRYDQGDLPSGPQAGYADANERMLHELISPRGRLLNAKLVQMWADDGQTKWRIASRKAAEAICRSDMVGYSDIIIDVSAMPRSIYLPAIAKALHVIGIGGARELPGRNLHVIAAENAELDRLTTEVNPDDTAEYLHGFGSLDTAAKVRLPMIWMPMLGENQQAQLERIYQKVNPSEICPILPALSRDPRRGDKLLVDEYHDILFDRWHIEAANIIYAAEQNPFEAYRQIRQAALHYGEALRPVGGCRVVLSAMSSKLLSIGALLAIYELRASIEGNSGIGVVGVGIAHVEAQRYVVSKTADVDDIDKDTELFGLWLAGECYE